MTFDEAKIAIARVAGDHGDPDSREVAGEMLKAAIRDWNTEHNWEFKFREEPAYALDALSTDIEIEGLKKVHTIRSLDPAKQKLTFTRLRTLDWAVGDQSPTGEPTHYAVIENSEQVVIRVWPTPDEDTTFYVRYYEQINEPSESDDVIDVPTRYLNGLLALAKFHYLTEKDTENARLQVFSDLAQKLLRKAIRDDKKQPDENEQMISRWEASGGHPDEFGI